MLSIDPIVRVAVYATAGTVSPESFDTGLILSGSNASTVTEEDRLRTFTSAAFPRSTRILRVPAFMSKKLSSSTVSGSQRISTLRAYACAVTTISSPS